MWEALNENAPAVQALASLATLIVTGVFARVTWRYVQLTNRLADAASEQLRFQQEATRAKWHELWGYVKLLNRALSELPDETRRATRDKDIRSAFLWDQSDLARFQSLAAQLGSLPGTNAALVVSSMSWLRDRVEEVRAVPRERGINYDRDFPWDRWCGELKRARDRLDDVREALKPKLTEAAA